MFLHRLPVPGRPDPKILDFWGHHLLVSEFMTIVLISSIFWLLLIPVRNFFMPDSRLLLRASFYGMSWLVIGLIIIVDPGHFFEWYCD